MLTNLLRSTAIMLACTALGGCIPQQNSLYSDTQEVIVPASSPVPISPESSPAPYGITAQFEIYANGTKRIFTQSKYHRQSPDVFIESSDPRTVQVLKKDITWKAFFDTLPFTLNKDCLVTGTQQTFCSNEREKLRFFINETETPNALDLPIEDNDFLKVTYGR